MCVCVHILRPQLVAALFVIGGVVPYSLVYAAHPRCLKCHQVSTASLELRVACIRGNIAKRSSLRFLLALVWMAPKRACAFQMTSKLCGAALHVQTSASAAFATAEFKQNVFHAASKQPSDSSRQSKRERESALYCKS